MAGVFIGIGQTALATYIAFGSLGELWRGHYETQSATTVQQIAYQLFVSPIGVSLWAALSFVFLLGVLLRRGLWRWRCIVCYATGVILLMLLELLVLLLLAQGTFSERWVYTGGGVARPYAWNVFVADPNWYWQFPVLTLLANPAFILLAFRLFRGLATRVV